MTLFLATAITLTNAVGGVMHGEYVSSTPSSVTVRTAARMRTIPFTSLAPAERMRILSQYGELPESPEEREIYARYQSERARIEGMVRDGWMKREVADRQLAAERRNALHRLSALGLKPRGSRLE